MVKNKVLRHDYFCGNKVSPYGMENGWLDYLTLSRAFNHILANDLIEKTMSIGEWDLVNGVFEDDEGNAVDIYQWYIIDENGYDVLSSWTNEIIYYNEELDLYLWGVTHFGTSWDYVLTDVRLEIAQE